MLTSIAAAVLIASGHRGVTGPRPVMVLEMRFEQVENTHIADHGGAINWRLGAKVNLELFADGGLTGTDKGSSFEHNLFPTYSTDEEKVWMNTWTGAWARAMTGKSDSLTLDLRLAVRSCKRTKRSTGAAAEALACGAISKRIRFACVTRQVQLEDAPGKAQRARTQAAWQCDAPADADLAETPGPWLFGKAGCLLVRGGHREPMTFAPCGPSR